MYQVIGTKNLLVGFAFCTLAFFLYRLQVELPDGLVAHLQIMGKAVGISSALILGLGSSPAFPLLCRLPGLRSVAPDISGDWDVTVESNWPAIAAMAGEPAPAGSPIVARVRVKARLLRVTINLDTATRYSHSKTVSVSAARDEDTGEVKLYYIYANHTPEPVASDSSHHFGAAYVDFVGQGKNMKATGLYWSNRNWTRGWNTAGKTEWRRPADFMSGKFGWLKL